MKNRIKAVLFDMDGTLVRIGEKEFTENYLTRLCRLICPLGYDKDTFIRAIWAGVGAMIKNDGTRINSECFWDTFSALLGEGIRAHVPLFEQFYSVGDFRLTREVTKPNPAARQIVDTLHAHGIRTVLATNPLFPACAQHTRLSWVDLLPQDFELITDYDNCRYAKPSIDYYRSILETTGLAPDECIMVGNSVSEDILPAAELGITTFLITEYASGDITLAPNKGNFSDMMNFLSEQIGM